MARAAAQERALDAAFAAAASGSADDGKTKSISKIVANFWHPSLRATLDYLGYRVLCVAMQPLEACHRLDDANGADAIVQAAAALHASGLRAVVDTAKSGQLHSHGHDTEDVRASMVVETPQLLLPRYVGLYKVPG